MVHFGPLWPFRRCSAVLHPCRAQGGAMAAPVPVTVCVAIFLSVAIVVVMVETGLNRTVFAIIPSLAIVVFVWMAYPPAQQLPPLVSVAFWGLITYVLY